MSEYAAFDQALEQLPWRPADTRGVALTNAERAARAMRALRFYEHLCWFRPEADTHQTALNHLLIDIQHLCRRQGLDYTELHLGAVIMHGIEVGESNDGDMTPETEGWGTEMFVRTELHGKSLGEWHNWLITDQESGEQQGWRATPGSRYGFDADDCAWWAIAADLITTQASDEPDDPEAGLQHLMGLAVNDDASIGELIRDHWRELPEWVREVIAAIDERVNGRR